MIASSPGLILLDRDGVLNSMVIHSDHGTVDSPLCPSEVEVFPWVPELLRELTDRGFMLAVCTNQPSAAKGKTTIELLRGVHQRVLELAQANGGLISSSHICFHRSEDKCICRKPKPGLLKEAIAMYPSYPPESIWMVGDGITDVIAGAEIGIQTAFLGPKKCDACHIFEKNSCTPTFWGKDLRDFFQYIIDHKQRR